MSLEKFKKQKRSRDKKEKKSGKNKRPKAASVESEEPYDARTSIDQDHAQLDFEVAASVRTLSFLSLLLHNSIFPIINI
jgi:hypothetical protein